MDGGIGGVGVAVAIMCLIAGVFVGFMLADVMGETQISAEVKGYAKRMKFDVVNTGKGYVVDIDSPLVKVLFWQVGGPGLVLGEARATVKWQIVLGCEDNPYEETQGDCLDVIVKICIFDNTPSTLYYSVVCAGMFDKKVYYNNQVKLDTTTGARSAGWETSV